jgi:AraC-like DNA-binding protein
VLETRPVVEKDGLTIHDVSCSDALPRGRASEVASTHSVVLVRRGWFVRHTDGVSSVLDPTAGYCTNPGEEARFDHPHALGDTCTDIRLEPSLVASLCDDESLPSGPMPTSSDVDLQHRLLLASAHRGADPDELFERAIGTAASALAPTETGPLATERSATGRARADLVSGAREALAADPGLSLVQLARALAVSPHHLSRIFRRDTGHSISRHRMRLRTRAALEQLAGGERNLARLAADLGFSDQSHLWRVVRAETGTTPSALRDLLGPEA